MNRLVLVVVVALLAFGLMMPGTAISKSTLGVVIYKDNPGQDVPTRELIEKWAKANDVDVDITIGGHSNRLTIATTALEGGSGPDLLLLADYEPNLFANGLLDISDLATEIGKKNGGWYKMSEQIGTANGKWNALPIYMYMHEMIYRKDVLSKAGVNVPNNWIEFRKTLEKIKKSSPSVIPFGVSYGRAFDAQLFLISLIVSNGGKVLSDDGKSVAFNSPETVAAVKYATDLYKDGLVDPTVMGWDDGTNNQAMLSGRIAFTFNSFSIKMAAEQDFKEMNPKIGAAVYPAGSKSRYSFPFTVSYAIRKTSKEPELAKKLLAYLFEKNNYAYVLESTSGATGVTLKGFAELPFWNKKPDWKVNLDAIPSASLFAPPSAETSEVYNKFVIVDTLADVLVRHMTPQQAVSKAAATMDKIYFKK
jgi:multiple sugar transport system substrate-binding protein